VIAAPPPQKSHERNRESNPSTLLQPPKRRTAEQKKPNLLAKLTKDSFGSQRLGATKSQKGSRVQPQPSKFTYKGKEIGNFRVICRDRGVLPPQLGFTILTLVITAGPSFLQLLYVNPHYVANRRTSWERAKSEGREDGDFTLDTVMLLVNIAFVMTCSLSCGFLLAASMTDPGIIPRKNASSNSDGASSNGESRRRYFIPRKLIAE